MEQQAGRIIGHVYNADNSDAATGNRVSVTELELEDVPYIGLYGGCSEGSVLAIRFAVMHADC